METVGNASEATVDCPKPLCEFLSSPWRLRTPENRSFSSDKRFGSSRARNSKLLRRRFRRPTSTLHPASRLLCGAGRLCDSPLPISQVLQTIKEVWVEPRSSSLGRASMAPACGRHQLGLPRRRYSVPETVMRRYVLARADSRPDSVGGVSEPPPSESMPSSSNSPVTSSVSLGSAYAPSSCDSKSSSDPTVEPERSDRADKSCQYNELETADNVKGGLYIVGAYGAKTYPDVKPSSTDSNGDNQKILRLESLVSAGSTYRKKEEAKLTVPRYSALPRSISMLVNTSSVDNSSDGDSDTDGLSLVDSLEDRCVSAKRPVAREVAKAFFVSIEEGGETRESDTPRPNQKTLALSMPEKIKENITRRQRQIELKRQERKSSPSDKETPPLKTVTARRKLSTPRRKIVPHSCVGKSRTLPAMTGRKVVAGAKKKVPEEPHKTESNVMLKAPSKMVTVQTEVKGGFPNGLSDVGTTNSNTDENKIKDETAHTLSKNSEVKCSNIPINDRRTENCEQCRDTSVPTKSKLDVLKRVPDTVKSEDNGLKMNENKKREEKYEVRSTKIEGIVPNEGPKNNSLLKGKRCSSDKRLTRLNTSPSPNESPSDDSGKTDENCQQKLTVPKSHVANALKPLEAPKNPPFVPAIQDSHCSNLPMDQNSEDFTLQRSLFKSAIPIKKSTSLNYRKFNVDISLSQQSSKPSPLSLRRPVRRFQPSPPLSRLSNINRYHQRFDVIPEEKSGSLDSSNDDATRLAIDKTKKSAFSYNSQQISAVNKCNKLGNKDLHKGKASLSNDPDLLTLSKGWINFYLLKESQLEESVNEEGTADKDKVKIPSELEWAPDKNTLKAPQLKRQPLAPVERFPSSGELACSESSSIYSTSDTDTSILPLRWQGSKVQHRTHVKRKQQGFQAAASSAGWSVTVASSLQHSPELEMRLSFPVCAHKTPASQSDSGLGEDTNNNNHSSSNSGHFLPLAQPQQRWTLTLRNQPQGTEKNQEGQKNGKRPFQCLPDLSFHPGQNKNSKKAIKAANIVLPTVTKTTSGSRRASAQSTHSIAWPNINNIINHNEVSRKLSTSVPNLLSIQGSAITPKKKPGVLTMSERNTTRVHTARN